MSIVRDNLMNRLGYTPYCGSAVCSYRMPRTQFIKKQFQCSCGWRSNYEDEFISQYQAKWADPKPTLSEERAFMAQEYRHAGERFE